MTSLWWRRSRYWWARCRAPTRYTSLHLQNLLQPSLSQKWTTVKEHVPHSLTFKHTTLDSKAAFILVASQIINRSAISKYWLKIYVWNMSGLLWTATKSTIGPKCLEHSTESEMQWRENGRVICVILECRILCNTKLSDLMVQRQPFGENLYQRYERNCKRGMDCPIHLHFFFYKIHRNKTCRILLNISLSTVQYLRVEEEFSETDRCVQQAACCEPCTGQDTSQLSATDTLTLLYSGIAQPGTTPNHQKSLSL